MVNNYYVDKIIYVIQSDCFFLFGFGGVWGRNLSIPPENKIKFLLISYRWILEIHDQPPQGF